MDKNNFVANELAIVVANLHVQLAQVKADLYTVTEERDLLQVENDRLKDELNIQTRIEDGGEPD